MGQPVWCWDRGEWSWAMVQPSAVRPSLGSPCPGPVVGSALWIRGWDGALDWRRNLVLFPAHLGLRWGTQLSPGALRLNAIEADTCNLGLTQTTVPRHACDPLGPGRAMLWGLGRPCGSGCPSGPGRPQRGPDPLSLQFGAIRVRCLFTPCHTSGHMCYFMWEDGSPDAPALFSGIPPCLHAPHGYWEHGVCCLSPPHSGRS